MEKDFTDGYLKRLNSYVESPAFPGEFDQGISVIDYFSAHALKGILAGIGGRALSREMHPKIVDCAIRCAKLLAERLIDEKIEAKDFP